MTPSDAMARQQSLDPLELPCPVAVCIPAYGDPDNLASLLSSLEQLDYPRDLLQVVVAVDGPDPALEETARRFGAETTVLPANRGSYAARNAAVACVGEQARVVAFTDTDVIVGPDWIRDHVRALQTVHMSGGAVRFSYSSPPRPAEFVDAVRHLNQPVLVESLGYGATANLAVRREVLDAVSFDAAIRSGGDREFGRRARLAGFTLAYTDSAWVTHPARATVAGLLRKVDRVARGIRQLRSAGLWSPPAKPFRRGSAVARAHRDGVSPGAVWDAQVWALDQLCNVIWALRVPGNIWPAVRRRLRAWRDVSNTERSHVVPGARQ